LKVRLAPFFAVALGLFALAAVRLAWVGDGWIRLLALVIFGVFLLLLRAQGDLD
jgi:hypothetical protein